MLVIEKKGRLTVRKRRVQGNDEFGVHILLICKGTTFFEPPNFMAFFWLQSQKIPFFMLFYTFLCLGLLGFKEFYVRPANSRGALTP